MKPISLTLTVGLLIMLVVVSCGRSSEPPVEVKARNVILFIGDGLGAAQTSVGLHYAREIQSRTLSIQSLMEQGNTGFSLPLPHGGIVTDSAAAATQMAAGERVLPETMGLDPDGYELESILDWAESQGKATGVVSNMRLTHATPAGFASHQIWRYQPEWEIADDVLTEHEIEVILGGGGRAFVPQGTRVSQRLEGVPEALDADSNRVDERDLVGLAEGRGMRIVSDRTSLAGAVADPSVNSILGLFAGSHLPFAIDRKDMALQEQVPTLAELTDAALEVLSRSDEGFFLMVEGGRIDYAGHENDIGSMIHEILDFDDAVAAALRFTEGRDDTLVIVTGDHGTGGVSFSYADVEEVAEPRELPSGLSYRASHVYANPGHLSLAGEQKASFTRSLELLGDEFTPDDLTRELERSTGFILERSQAEALHRGLTDESVRREILGEFYNDPESDPQCLIGRFLGGRTFTTWSTGGHTMEPVPTYATGPCAEKLRGVYLNTHIHGVMKSAFQGECR